MDVETLTPDAEETSMRELGIQTDAAQGREPEVAQTPEPRPPAEPEQPQAEQEVQQPEAEQQPEVPETPEEKLGRDIKTGQFKKAEKPDTEYSKAVKEEIRKTRTWQNIQAEKEQHRQEVAQWQEQRRMEQLEAARANYQPLKKEGLTAQQYYEGAQVFEQEGDHARALQAYKVSSELSRAEQQRYQQFQQVDKEYQWRKQLQQVAQVEPKAFDPSTPIGSHVQRIVNGNPEIYNLRNGFLYAAEFAHMLTQVEQMKEKDDEIIRLKAELEKTQRKGQPARGGYASPRMGEKNFDDMSLDEQEVELRRMTAEARITTDEAVQDN